MIGWPADMVRPMTPNADYALALTEEDAVEVLAALDLAAKVQEACGDVVMSKHYRYLWNRLSAEVRKK